MGPCGCPFTLEVHGLPVLGPSVPKQDASGTTRFENNGGLMERRNRVAMCRASVLCAVHERCDALATALLCDRLTGTPLLARQVGWVNGNSSEFVVAIRSALVEPTAAAATLPAAAAEASRGEGFGRLRLYAGVGLVPGASPHAEWRELNLKIKPFRCVHSSGTVHAFPY